MKSKTKYSKFISKISSIFLSQYDIDKAIYKVLGLLAKKTDADRAYIFLFKDDKRFMDNTHEYCANGVEPAIDQMQDIHTHNIDWWLNELKEKKVIDIPDTSKLPTHAGIEKETLESQDIKALICYPFFLYDELIGFIGLDNTKRAEEWSKRSKSYLFIASNILGKALEKEEFNKKLTQTNSTLQATLESSEDAIIVVKNTGEVINYNKNFIDLWDIKNEEVLEDTLHILSNIKHTIAEPNSDIFEKKILESFENTQDYDFLAHKKNGTILRISSKPIYIDDKHIGRVWKCIDITKQKEYEQKMQLISKVYEKSNDAILITDAKVKILDVNSSFEKITGYELKDILGKNPSLLQSKWHDTPFYKELWTKIDKEGFWEGEIWDRRKNGEVYISRTFISKIENDSNITNYIAIAKDITRKKEYEEKIKQLAFYDVLTALPNRAFFEQNLNSIMDESKRYKRRFGLLFLDLDNFKYVNDTFGHLVGDKLLQVVSTRLLDCVRKSDIVARLGGDEFTIIVRDIKDELDLVHISKKIISHLLDPIFIDEQELYIGTSIGICIYPEDAKSADELTKKADIAMYNSKNNGKNTYSFFSDDMNKSVLERYKKEQYMRESIIKGEFKMEYQPFMCCDSSSINAVEALIRWDHPKLGRVMPSEFIHIAEENGLILKLGEWIFDKVCEDFKVFTRHNIKKVSVNISAKQFMDGGFAEFVKRTIEKYKIDPSFLEFEITEDIFLNKTPTVIKNLKEFEELGISFALDDFGTGYSSLNYIKQFAIDTVKIDKSFVDTMFENEKDMAIVNTILYLSKQLDKKVVAEGVENQEQFDYFKTQNSCNIQGYILSKPVAIDGLDEVIQKHTKDN